MANVADIRKRIANARVKVRLGMLSWQQEQRGYDPGLPTDLIEAIEAEEEAQAEYDIASWSFRARYVKAIEALAKAAVDVAPDPEARP